MATPAGTELRPYAEQAVAAADGGAQAIRNMQALGGGVATFGLLRNADFYLLSDLVELFLERHPTVRVRMVGLNSVETAAAVAAGELEAGLVVLPIDDDGLSVTPLLRDEVFYASSDPARVAEPMTIERFSRAKLVLYDAHYGWTDPTRRQLLERAQLAGLKIEPWIEVEHVESALNWSPEASGTPWSARQSAAVRCSLRRCCTVPFAEPLYDTIALVQRVNGLLSPGTRELAKLAQRMLIGARPPGATMIRGVVRKGARSERS